MTQTDMRNFKHDECIITRGIKVYGCIKCGKTATNYTNGVNICIDCRIKLNLCAICGKSLYNDYEEVANIFNNMFIEKSESLDNCEEEYKIWEVFELPNKDNVKFVCSLDIKQEWKYNDEYCTLVCEDETGYKNAIEDSFNFEELLKSTFKIVDLKEINNEWIIVNENFYLHKALINNHKLRVNGVTLKQSPNDEQIITLFGMLEDGIATIEYLKENE